MILTLQGHHLQFGTDRRPFTDADRDTLRDLHRRYERATGTARSLSALQGIGDDLFRWLDRPTAWGARLLAECAHSVLHVHAAGTEAALLDAPWELLRDPSLPHLRDEPLADPAFLVRSHRLWPVRHLTGWTAPPRPPTPHALSILFMAASPEGQHRLGFEAEEAAIQGAVAGTNLDLIVEETGSLGELARRLSSLLPVDVLHLTCHGLAGDEPALFLEDELGREARVTASQLLAGLGSDAQKLGLCVVSACQTATSSPLGSLVRSLVQGRVPAVLGWAASVGDREATELVSKLYGALAVAGAVPEALRDAIVQHLQARPGSRDWHLPRLYLGPAAPVEGLCARARRTRYRRAVPLKRFFGRDGRVPVADGTAFVGRRRALQRCLRVLRGEDHVGVLLHGVGQLGKSSLAARLADRLTVGESPFCLAVCHGAQELDARSVLERVDQALADEAWTQAYKARWEADPELTLEPALRKAATDHDLLLVLDDLEQVLDPTRTPVRATAPFDRVLADVVRAFASGGRGRLVWTSRYDFAVGERDGLIARESLGGLTEAEQVRLVQGAELAPELRRRCLHGGRGNPGLTTRLLQLAGQSPGAAAKVLAQLEAKDTSGLEEQEILDFFRRVALEGLVGLLEPSERALAEAALVFEVPVPRVAVEALAEVVEVERPGERLDRLLALGVCEEHRDLVSGAAGAVQVSELVRGRLAAVPEEVEGRLVRVGLKALVEVWGLDGLEPPATLATYRLALRAEDGKVLAKVAASALWLLMAAHETKEAAAQAERVVACVGAQGEVVEAPLAAVCFDLGERTGRMGLLRPVLEWDGTGEAFVRASLLRRQGVALARLGRVEEALRAARQAAAEVERAVDPKARAACFGATADIYMACRQLDEALRIRTEDELPVLEELGDVAARAVTLSKIADTYMARGRLDEALRIRVEMELPVFEQLGDLRSRAITLGKVADIYMARGQLDEALRIRVEEELPAFEQLGDVRCRAVTLGRLVDFYMVRGQSEESLRILIQELVPVYEQLGDVRERAVALGQVADIRMARGQLDDALRIHMEEELPVYEQIGDVRSRAITLGKLADIYMARGQLDEALRIRTEEQLPVYERLGDVRSRAITLGKLADIHLARGQLDEALHILTNELLPAFEQQGDVRSRAVALGRLANIHILRGQFDDALRICTDEMLPVYEQLGDVRERAATWGKLADICAARGKFDEAIRIRIEEQLPVFDQVGEVHSLIVVRVNLAITLVRRGRQADAPEVFRLLLLAHRAAVAHGYAPQQQQIEQIMQQLGMPVPASNDHIAAHRHAVQQAEDPRDHAIASLHLAVELANHGALDEATAVARAAHQGATALGHDDVAAALAQLLDAIEQARRG